MQIIKHLKLHAILLRNKQLHNHLFSYILVYFRLELLACFLLKNAFWLQNTLSCLEIQIVKSGLNLLEHALKLLCFLKHFGHSSSFKIINLKLSKIRLACYHPKGLLIRRIALDIVSLKVKLLRVKSNKLYECFS